MKKTVFYLICFIGFAFQTGFCQTGEQLFERIKTDHTQTAWYKELLSANPNYWKIKKEYESYFISHKVEGSKQEKICRRWLQVNEGNVDKDGYLLPGLSAQQLTQTFAAKLNPTELIINHTIPPVPETLSFQNDTIGSWRMIGPFHSKKTKCNGVSAYMTGGFTDRVYINPYNSTNMYAGTSFGGLWVSQNAGTTWKLTDAAFPNGTSTYADRDYYYGDIKASAQNPQLVYAATEAGLLKSTTGGDSWSYCNQLNRTVTPTLRPYFVAVAHNNQSVILSSFGKKIYKSSDAGNSWALVFDNTNGSTTNRYMGGHNPNSVGLKERRYNFWGLDFHPTNANIVYLGVWNASNEPCIYRSVDNGNTFSFLVNVKQATGRAVYNPKDVEMVVVPSAPDKVFVRPFIAKDTIYHFNQDGAIVNRILPGRALEAFAINWRNENIVYAGYYGPNPDGSIVNKSTDGGITFTGMTSGGAGCPIYIHPDIRGYAAVGDTVLVGHDGGISRSFDGMATIESIGYDISAIDLWGFSSSFKGDISVAGCDHGPTEIRFFDGNEGWQEQGGGDAATCFVNPANDSLIYYDHGYGTFLAQINANGTVTKQPVNDDYFKFDRFETHPNVYNKVYAIIGNTIQAGPITDLSLFKNFGMPVTRFQVALKNPKVMYALLKGSIVQKTIDGGITWVTITPTALQSNNQTVIADIELGANPNDVWLIYGAAQNACKVLKTTDGGSNWENITGSLSQKIALESVYQRGTNGGLYVYLEGDGVFYRNNTMPQWQQLGTGLPTLGYSRNLYTVPVKNKFRMGSSRGAWEHDLIETSGLDVQIAMDKNVCDRSSNIVSFRDYSAFNSPVTFEWSFPGGQPSTSTAEFPKVQYNTPGVYPVSLTIRDGNGNSQTQNLDSAVTVILEALPGLAPIADAFVRGGTFATANFGSDSALVVKNDGLEYYRISYLKFDLTNTSFTDSVKLRLFVNSGSAGTNWKLWYCPNDSWTESGINWNNKPDTVSVLGLLPSKPGGIAEWNITNQVNAEKNGDKILTLAVTSTKAGGTLGANFNSKEFANFLLRPQLSSNNIMPSVVIASPLNNSTFSSANPITISATASDADGAITKVEFYADGVKVGEDFTTPYNFIWNGATVGNHLLIASTTDDRGAVSGSSIVNITVNAAPVVSITSPVNNATFTAPVSVTINADATVSSGTITKVEFFNGAIKLGEDLTAPYSYSWTDVASGTYELTAIATSNTNATSTSSVVNITVNAAPVVNITSPVNNATFTAPASVTINADATVSSGTISKVEFFNGATKLGEDLTAPYSYSWTGVAAGTYALTAIATSNTNTTSRSSVVNITVNAVPVVSITSPVNNATFTAPVSVTINANATVSSGTITKVEFFNGAIKLGEDLTSPYSYSWTGVAAGTYALTAKATSNTNATTTSSVVNITVNAAAVVPVVSITSPANNATFTAPASVTINATATVSSGTISKVEFFKGATKLGEDLTAPYSYSWTGVAAGTYALTAKATSNTNAVTTSSIANITVNAASVCNNSLEPNATLGAAIAITTSSTLKSQIASATDLDWFKFTPTTSGIVTITLTTLPFDYDLHLLNASGTELVKSDKTGTTNESLSYSVSAGVTYYIKVLGWGGVFSTTSCYTLSISGVVTSLVATQPSLSLDAITTAKVKKATTTADKLSVTASPNPSNGEFNLSIKSNSTEKIQVRVMDLNGRLVKVITVNVGAPIQFGRSMKAGTYLVEVKQGPEKKIVKVVKL